MDERGKLLPKEELLLEMINGDVIPKATENICRNYLKVGNGYQEFFDKEEDFEIPILSWIKSWINAL